MINKHYMGSSHLSLWEWESIVFSPSSLTFVVQFVHYFYQVEDMLSVPTGMRRDEWMSEMFD